MSVVSTRLDHRPPLAPLPPTRSSRDASLDPGSPRPRSHYPPKITTLSPMRITISDRDPHHTRFKSAHWFKGAESMLAGAGAGLVTSVVTCPLDVIKTKLQAGGAFNRDPNGLIGTLQFRLPPNFESFAYKS